MKYLFDTNICIYTINKKPQKLINKIIGIPVSDIGISSITLSELEYGVAKSMKQEQNRVALTEFLLPLQIYFFDDFAAREYGKIRYILEKKGEPIGAIDMFIAAHALSLNVILVTNNVREFKRVPELRIENWAE